MNIRIHNFAAIIVCTVLSMAIPMLWYMIFADAWMQGNGLTIRDIEDGHSVFPYVIAGIGSFAGAYILSWLMIALKVESFIKGLCIALMIGIAFCYLPLATQNSFAFRPNELSFIDGGVNLFNWMISGGILASWKKFENH